MIQPAPGDECEQGKMDDPTRSIKAARRSLETVRRRLLHPTLEAFCRCQDDIESTILSMRQVEARLQSGPKMRKTVQIAAGAELHRLRRELAQVNALLQNAGQFYSGWALLILPQDDVAANYTPAGTTAERPERRMVLHG